MQTSHYFKYTHIRKAQTPLLMQSEACALLTLSINKKTYTGTTPRLPILTGQGLPPYP